MRLYVLHSFRVFEHIACPELMSRIIIVERSIEHLKRHSGKMLDLSVVGICRCNAEGSALPI